MVTSAADLWDLQTKPNQIMHIYPYMIYLFENGHDQRTPKSAPEFTIVLSLAWRSQKGIICRGKYAFFGLVWFGCHQNQLQRSP